MTRTANQVQTFPLRLRNPRLRELLRQVAKRDHLSQNELIEQALEHELALRGAHLAEELAAAARSLAELSDEMYARRLAEHDASFAEGESGPEPFQARALHGPAYPPPSGGERVERNDPLGVLRAFASHGG